MNHDPVNIKLQPINDTSFKMLVTAPFFNDPAKPNSESGQPLFGLWEYEGTYLWIQANHFTSNVNLDPSMWVVVELFLLNDNDQYVEIELCPWVCLNTKL